MVCKMLKTARRLHAAGLKASVLEDEILWMNHGGGFVCYVCVRRVWLWWLVHLWRGLVEVGESCSGSGSG